MSWRRMNKLRPPQINLKGLLELVLHNDHIFPEFMMQVLSK